MAERIAGVVIDAPDAGSGETFAFLFEDACYDFYSSQALTELLYVELYASGVDDEEDDA